MRGTRWRAVTLVSVLGLALLSCTGPNRGSSTQPSSASGYRVVLNAGTNALPATEPGAESDLGGCTWVQATVFDSNNRLVDGVDVFFATSIGKYRVGDEDFGGFVLPTRRGLANLGFCARDQRGTANLTATVEDAVASLQITIF